MYDVSNKFKEHVKNNGYIEKSARKAVDEVARIKWSDFVLEPSKPNLISGWDIFTFTGIDRPNLIKDGWESFKGVDNGVNYVPNWDFSSNENPYRPVGALPEVKNNVLHLQIPHTSQAPRFAYAELELELPKGEYIYRARVRGGYPLFVLPYSGVESKTDISIKDGGVGEGSFTVVEDKVKLFLYPMENAGEGVVGQETFVEWIQVTPKEKQHLVLETKKLGEQGIEVLTFGGTSTNKFRNILPGAPLTEGETYNTSVYVENLGSTDVIMSSNTSYNFKTVKPGEKGFFSKHDKAPNGYQNLAFKSKNANDSLHFVAYYPEIVEAKHPNIKVHMNQENTLMHIKTFGGNDKRKLYGTIGRFPSGSRFQQSIYIENYGPDVYVSGHTGTVERHKVETGYKGWMHFPAWVDGPSWMDFSFGAETPDECLDFKCTLPQIVEGDVPNPELVVQTLDDGRSHVRVFGATPETKLVHKSTKGFTGEPYTLSTEIENEGLQLQMDTNLSEQSETIRKGDNQVNIEGNLEGNNIEIKLGTE